MTAETQELALPLRTIGPSTDGKFVIVDARSRLWDGAEWRGFGEPERYSTYGDAFRELCRIKRAALPALPSSEDVTGNTMTRVED